MAIVTLVARDDDGLAIARTGAKVTFTQAGGTSVVTFGPTTDRGDGTYQANVTGVTEGTKIGISAVLDGAPLTTAPASFRVANPIAAGLTFSIDAANADRAGNFDPLQGHGGERVGGHRHRLLPGHRARRAARE